MVLLLLGCILFFYLWRLANFLRLTAIRSPGANPWPRIFLGSLAWVAGVRISVIGERRRSGVLLIANHVSWIDIPALAKTTGTAFVAHDGLAGIPALRWLCELNRTVFIARHDRGSVGRQVEQLRSAIGEAGALTIFPEGTTSDGTGLLPIKSSLLSAIHPMPEGIAVQPVYLDYGREAPAIAWVGDEHGVDNFLRILARARPIRLTLHFLPPLEGESLKDRKTIAAAAREALLGASRWSSSISA